MLASRSPPERLLEFVRNIRTDKYTFPVCHKKLKSPFLTLKSALCTFVVKRVYKPNLVPAETGDDHSSRPSVTCRLKQPTRKRRRISPALSGQLIKRFPIWPCTARSLPGRMLLPAFAGELLPHRFTHHPFGLVCSLLHLSSSSMKMPGRYPARCPLVFGLSSFAHGKSDHPTRSTIKAQKL